MNPLQFAMQMMQKNPAIANDPEKQRMLDVLQNGSPQEQEQLARELCQARGITPEQAMQQAQGFFNFQNNR